MSTIAPRLNSPQEATSNTPHTVPLSLHSIAPEEGSGRTYNTNNSSGTLNRVTGDQRFDASSTSTLLNCEGTSIQLVVISGEAAAAAHATGQALSRGDGDRHDCTKCTKHGTEMRRLQTRADELESDMEWMEVRAEGLALEVETLRDDVRALSSSLRRLQREFSAARRTGRNREDRARGTSGRSYRY